MAADNKVSEMTGMLDEKAGLLDKMFAYTREQTQAITEDDIDTLEKLVQKKQKIIDKINLLDEKFEQVFAAFKQELGIGSLDELKKTGRISGARELRERVEDIVSITGRIKVVEEENRDKAKRLLNVIEDKMKKINSGKRLSTAYKPASPGDRSYFFDKKK